MNLELKLAGGLAAILLASGLSACFGTDSDKDKNPGGGDSGTQYYTLGVRAGDPAMNYLLSVDSLLTGTISPVGNGLEVAGSGDFALQSGKYLYDFTRTGKQFTQYELLPNGTVVKGPSINGTALIADRAYSKNLIDDSTLLYIDPLAWGKPEMKWVTIRIPAFTVKASGTFTLPLPANDTAWRVNPGRALVVGNKLFMGSVYYNATGTVFRPGAHAFVLDFPAMTNPTLITHEKVNAELGITSTANMFKTENGDLYFAGSAGSWGNADTSKPNKGTLIRIKNGATAFDTTWVLDFSQVLGEPTNVMQFHYVGGNVGIALLYKDSAAGSLDGLIYSFAKVDIAAKTVVKYNVPKSAGRLSRFPLIKDGKYYTFYKTATDSKILEIDIAGGPSAYKLGSTVSGTGVTGYGIYAHPRD